MTAIGEAKVDWRDSLALAADLALLGIVVSLTSLLVLPAGGALAAASVAADHAASHRSLPPLSTMVTAFRRGFWPGLAAFGAFLTAGFLLGLDLAALASGRVPGGMPVLVLTAAVGCGALAVALLCLVRVGSSAAVGWRSAAAWSVRVLAGRPQVGLALLATVAVPVALALAVPVIAPLLVGFALFALHVVVRRLTPTR